MSKCLVCKNNAEHECPVCKKSFCEDHILPDQHSKFCKLKTKNQINFEFKIEYLVVIFVIIGFFGLIYLGFNGFNQNSNQINSTKINENNKVIVNETIYLNISYNNLDNESLFDKDIKIKGFLSSTKIMNGFFYYVTDDFGNKITLIMDNEIRDSFAKKDHEKVHEISGVLRKRRNELQIVVQKIEESKRNEKIIFYEK